MSKTLWILTMALCVGAGWATETYPTVQAKDLPEGLKRVWAFNKPEMTAQSRCAAAFDGHGDPEKATLQCSVHIRMAAEGARRAMRYCEEKRAEHKIKDTCKIVVE